MELYQSDTPKQSGGKFLLRKNPSFGSLVSKRRFALRAREMELYQSDIPKQSGGKFLLRKNPPRQKIKVLQNVKKV